MFSFIPLDVAHAIEHVGIKPAKLIKAKPGDFTAEKDPVLKAALRYARKKR